MDGIWLGPVLCGGSSEGPRSGNGVGGVVIQATTLLKKDI